MGMCVTGAFVGVAAAVGNGAMVSRETSLCWCSIVGTSPAEAGTAGEAAGAVAGAVVAADSVAAPCGATTSSAIGAKAISSR